MAHRNDLCNEAEALGIEIREVNLTGEVWEVHAKNPSPQALRFLAEMPDKATAIRGLGEQPFGPGYAVTEQGNVDKVLALSRASIDNAHTPTMEERVDFLRNADEVMLRFYL